MHIPQLSKYFLIYFLTLHLKLRRGRSPISYANGECYLIQCFKCQKLIFMLVQLGLEQCGHGMWQIFFQNSIILCQTRQHSHIILGTKALHIMHTVVDIRCFHMKLVHWFWEIGRCCDQCIQMTPFFPKLLVGEYFHYH